MEPITENRTEKLAGLFQAYKWNYLPDAVLEGHTGRAWADNGRDPQVGILEFPKLGLSLVGGEAAHPSARDYIEHLPNFTALLFASEGWGELTGELHGDMSSDN